MSRYFLVWTLLVLTAACQSAPEPTPEPAASIRIASPADGATVENPISLEFQADGITVAPAGTFEPNTGHYHIIVDQPYVAAGTIVPADSVHLHFGDGRTSTEIELAPGVHTLRLQMGDGAHAAIEGLRDEITVTVQ